MAFYFCFQMLKHGKEASNAAAIVHESADKSEENFCSQSFGICHDLKSRCTGAFSQVNYPVISSNGSNVEQVSPMFQKSMDADASNESTNASASHKF